jgi:hypothetical protein
LSQLPEAGQFNQMKRNGVKWKSTLLQSSRNTRSRSFNLPGLPDDGLFSNQKSQFGKKFQGLRLENFDLFYGH